MDIDRQLGYHLELQVFQFEVELYIIVGTKLCTIEGCCWVTRFHLYVASTCWPTNGDDSF